MYIKRQMTTLFIIFLYVVLSLYALPDNETSYVTLSSTCPTCRRLFFLGGSNEKKSSEHFSHAKPKEHQQQQYTKPSSSSSTGLTVYIRPQTASELGRKVRSYSKLLKSKLYTKQELQELKRLKEEKKNAKKLLKPQHHKRNVTKNKPNSTITLLKGQSVKGKSSKKSSATINDLDKDRCRAILHINNNNNDIAEKSSKVKNSTKLSTKTKSSKEKHSSSSSKRKNKREEEEEEDKHSRKKKLPKLKTIAATVAAAEEEKKSKQKLNDHNTPIVPAFIQNTIQKKKEQVNEIPPPVRSTTSTPKKKVPVVVDREIVMNNGDQHIPVDDLEFLNGSSKNENVVGRAYHFVKNMFQLADDILENDTTESTFVSRNHVLEEGERQETDDVPHQKRKILSTLDNDHDTIVYNDITDYEIDLYLNDLGEKKLVHLDKVINKQCIDHNQCENDNRQLDYDLIYSSSVPKRGLLAVVSSKTTKNKKQKQNKTTANNAVVDKPRVGWQYRYRISRYIDAQQRSAGKQKNKQGKKKKSVNQATNRVHKRKLLQHYDNIHVDGIFDQQSSMLNINEKVDSVLITQEFVPKASAIQLDNLFMKRHLLAKKQTIREEKEAEELDEEEDIDQDEEEKAYIRKKKKKDLFEEPTEPQDIVKSYENGLYKPRVGWQFRYRVSRYIDSLRQNIREDQDRLKQGLKAIQRKTPQELSGRKKLRKDRTIAGSKENTISKEDKEETVIKPNVGFRYRYRVSKMLEAKRNGVYIDDEEERRKAKEKKKLDDKLELARKLDGSASKKDDDDECIEWENDLNSDLGKLSKEEKNVGWEYRYRIRRKLDDLKRQQPLTPVTTDAPGGKRLKKPITKKPDVDQQQQQLLEDQKKKIVGWKYRYRVSKMLEAQKQEKLDGTTSTKKTLSAKVINDKDKLDPILANLTPEQKEVGWAYRYRIRRKLDETRNATSRTDGGKRLRSKKPSNETTPEPTRTRKRKPKQKMKQIEEQIEKILNIEDIKETPFYEYFFMSYNYVLHELLPALHKSLCQLPIGMPFCDDTDDEVSQQKQEEKPPVQKKKLRTKKEQRAKQFIRTKASRLVSDDDNDKPIDETLKKIMKKATTATTIATPPTSTTTQVPKHDTADASGSSSNTITPKRKKAPHRRKVLIDEQVQHYDEEETPVKKVIGVETKKKNMKKRFHLIGKETKPSRHRNKTKTSIGTSSDIDSGKQSSNTVKSTIDHGVPQTFTNEKVEPPKPPNHLHLKQIITDDQTKTKNTDKTPVESNNNNRESSETTSKTNPTETKVPVRENLKLSDVVDKVKDDVVEKVNNVVEKVNDVGETIIQQPIVETVKKEAEKFLKHPNDDISSKKIAEETNEANEDILENSKLNQQQKTQTNDDEKDQTGNETDSEEESSDDDDNDNSDGEEEEEEDDDDNQKKDKKSEDSQGFLQSPIKKMNKYYENAKESVHDVFDLENDKNEPK